MFLPTSGRMYVLIFIVLAFFLPLMALAAGPRTPIALAVVCDAGVLLWFLLPGVMCSSSVVNYWLAMCLIAHRWRTGIVNLSLFVVLPVLGLYTAYFFVVAVFSLGLGRRFAQRALVRSAYRWSGGAFRLQPALDEIDRRANKRAERRATLPAPRRQPPRRAANVLAYDFDAPLEPARPMAPTPSTLPSAPSRPKAPPPPPHPRSADH